MTASIVTSDRAGVLGPTEGGDGEVVQVGCVAADEVDRRRTVGGPAALAGAEQRRRGHQQLAGGPGSHGAADGSDLGASRRFLRRVDSSRGCR